MHCFIPSIFPYPAYVHLKVLNPVCYPAGKPAEKQDIWKECQSNVEIYTRRIISFSFQGLLKIGQQSYNILNRTD